jgi:hypothetical protein
MSSNFNCSNLGTFWLKIEQFWPFEEISIFSKSGHLEWRAGLSDTILKGTHPGTIPLLHRNHWTNCNQTLVVWSLDGSLSKLCPVIPTSNQDGRQAKNRK